MSEDNKTTIAKTDGTGTFEATILNGKLVNFRAFDPNGSSLQTDNIDFLREVKHAIDKTFREMKKHPEKQNK